MNFACPNCNLAGQIDDSRLPEQGLYATCPKCKTRFLVQRETPAKVRTEVPEDEVVVNGSEAVAGSHRNSSPSAPPQMTKQVAVPMKRDIPLAVKVIGCLFIAVAGFRIIVVGIGYLALSSMTKMVGGMQQIPSGAPDASKMVQYLELWIALQILIAVFVIIAAVQFLRLRAWARTTLEVVSWLGLAYTIGTGIMGVFSFGKLMGSATNAGFGAAPSALGTMAVTLTAVTMVVFSVPLIVVIWFLRGKMIRNTVNL